MEKKVSLLIFSKEREVDLQEISKRYPGILVKKKGNFKEGLDSVIIFGPDNEINEIKKELQAEEIILGSEAEDIVDHEITMHPGESREQARRIVGDFHNSIVDMFEES